MGVIVLFVVINYTFDLMEGAKSKGKDEHLALDQSAPHLNLFALLSCVLHTCSFFMSSQWSLMEHMSLVFEAYGISLCRVTHTGFQILFTFSSISSSEALVCAHVTSRGGIQVEIFSPIVASDLLVWWDFVVLGLV